MERGIKWSAVERRMRSLVACSADARLVAVCRVLFGALALLYSFRYREFVEYIWLDSPYLGAIRVLAELWPWVILPLLFGLGGRVAGLCHYAFVIVLIEMQTCVRTPEQIFFGNLSFAFVLLQASSTLSVDRWIRGRRDSSYQPPLLVPAWPVFLLAITLGIQFGTSGLSKCVDPLWIHGKALYYVWAQPWIRGPGWDFVLEWPAALWILTMLALLFELSFLPLFLFSKTRWLAVLNLAVFGFTFFYPLTGMGLIGVFAFLSALLLASLLPRTVRSQRGRDSSVARLKPSFWERWVYFALLLLILAQTTFNVLPKILTLEYPRHGGLGDHLVLEGAARSSSPGGRLRDRAAQGLMTVPGRRQIARLNQLTTRAYWLDLFNSDHLIGLWTFRMQVLLNDGTLVEPVVVFSSQQRSGPDNGWTTPKWLHPGMYNVSALCNRRLANPLASPLAFEERQLKLLLRFPLSRLSTHQLQQAKEVRILVAPVAVPTSDGEVWTRPSARWQLLASQTLSSAAPTLNGSLEGPSPNEIRLTPGKTLRFRGSQ